MRRAIFGSMVALMFAGMPASAQQVPQGVPDFFTIDENNLLLGGLPSPAAPAAIDAATAARLFAAVKNEEIEYRYIVGSCEDRAHFVTLLAQSLGISVAKIWAIAPARYTLLSRALIAVPDPSGITDGVTWGHHVAPMVLVRDGAGPARLMVLDRSLSPDALMPATAWVAALRSPRALLLSTGPEDYLFRSLDGFTVWDNVTGTAQPSVTLPKWMPNLLTGDFQKYGSATDAVIARGMATNDLAMRIFTEKWPAAPPSDLRLLRDTIRSETAMETLIDGKLTLSAAVATSVAAFYAERTRHWLKRIAALRQAPPG